jgi:DNA modification methylase
MPDSKNTMFKEEWRPLCVYVKGVRDTQPIPPQISSTDKIGGGVEVWSDQVEFVKELLKKLSPANGTIVDPFMGKGIIGQAALGIGRTYIGIERESTLFLTAMNTLHDI